MQIIYLIRNKTTISIVFLFLFANFSYSQNIRGNKLNKLLKDSIPEKEYSFILQDSPSSLFSMRQSDENFLSLYRIGIGELNKNVSMRTSLFVQVLFESVFFMPLTHEEGHRSILTNEKIGAVSKPYYNKNLAAYVTGVTDAELISLRNNKLPVFTRMYTAGLESDYALLLRESSLLKWQDESMNVLWIEYFFRKINLISYYSMGLFEYNIGIDEEKNELDRDIAGHDVYGAIRSLHNPTMEFHRYIDYKDLLPEERQFVKRVGWRSLLNLIDPTLWMKNGFNIKNKYLANFSLGYTMSPFGDFIDEHVWLKTKSLKTHLYFRQYENKDTWFPALGLDCSNITLCRNFSSNIALHGWSQPKDFSFTQTQGELGGAIDILCKYRFPDHKKNKWTGISINLGIIAKTWGFLPEEVTLDNHLGIRIGTSIWIK